MSIQPQKYRSIPFVVEAIQVTVDNMQEVAEWSGGETMIEKQGGRLVSFVKVEVRNPMTERQTKAFVGDWVLKSETGVKTYSQRAFPKRFERTPMLRQSDLEAVTDVRAEIYEANRQAALFDSI